MKQFDLKKFIKENKATFHSSLSENNKEYYKDAEADDAEHIDALEKDMEDDKKSSKMKVSELKAKIKEMVLAEADEVKEATEELTEGIGTIALGIMLAYAGLKVLKFVAKKVVGSVGMHVKLEPSKLKEISTKVTKRVALETGSGTNVLLGIALKQEIDAKIDTGEIKTVNDIQKVMEDYLKTNQTQTTTPKEGVEKLYEDDEKEEEVTDEEEVDVDVEDPEPMEEPMDGGINVSQNADADLTGVEKEVQDNLEAALKGAQELNDEKLQQQIGNSLTFFTRTHVVK